MTLTVIVGEAKFDEEYSDLMNLTGVSEIISYRCAMCHAKEPLWDGLFIPSGGLVLETEEDILSAREIFIEKHEKELYDEAVTLCHMHHLRLHSIYGKRPKLVTAMKQKRWVEKQRVKYGVV